MTVLLTSLAALPGVRLAAVGDDAGRVHAWAGGEDAPATALLVLAHATLAAAAELGRRAGAGDCVELTQQHEGGCVFLHALPGGRVLLVRCQQDQPPPEVRVVAKRLMTLDPGSAPRLARPLARDLVEAFHAEPAW